MTNTTARHDLLPADRTPLSTTDTHGNVIALDGCDRCYCGCKYWEDDRCTDCGASVLLIVSEDV